MSIQRKSSTHDLETIKENGKCRFLFLLLLFTEKINEQRDKEGERETHRQTANERRKRKKHTVVRCLGPANLI